MLIISLFLAILQEKMFAEQALAKERAAEMLQESEKKVAEQKRQLEAAQEAAKELARRLATCEQVVVEKENQVRNINIKSQKIAAATQKLEIAAATELESKKIDAARQLESERIAAGVKELDRFGDE